MCYSGRRTGEIKLMDEVQHDESAIEFRNLCTNLEELLIGKDPQIVLPAFITCIVVFSSKMGMPKELLISTIEESFKLFER